MQPSKRKLHKGNNKDRIILILKTKRVKTSKIAPIFSVQSCKIHAKIKNKQKYDYSKKSLIKATSCGN
ncbi:hypothetical protein HpBGD97_12450 [Helicobacter pylori]